MSSEQTSLSPFTEFDQLTKFDSDMIKLFLSKTASSPDERFRILLVAITVTWSLCHARNTISANLANLIDRIYVSVGVWPKQLLAEYLIIAGCVIDQAVPSKKP